MPDRRRTLTAAERLLPGLDGPAPKAFRLGTHRAVAPEATIARVRPFWRAMGITRVADVTGLDRVGVPVVMVCRPNSRSLAVSQGKGLTLAAAKASGLMEAVELHHAERISLPLLLGSYEDLRDAHRLVDATALPSTVASAYHPTRPLLWTEGYDLLEREPAWVPYELVHANFTVPYTAGSGSFPMSTNGLASGNHLLEAISHGICEVVERDATTLWHLCDAATRGRSRIDLGPVDDPACRAVLDRCARAGIDVAAWDITTDVGIPAFYCVIVERDDDVLRPACASAGMGCHPSRDIALLRALTEAVQSRLTVIAGSRDDVGRGQYERASSPDQLRHYRGLIAAHGPTRRLDDVPDWCGETFDEDIDWELGRLRAAGVTRVVAVSLMQSAVGLPVVRVVIPGLEGPDDVPGYAPGPRARARVTEHLR